MLNHILEQIELAKQNRREFLAPHKERYKLANEKGQADIVVELIKIEPSHKDEPWIRDKISAWMRDQKYIDYIEAAFIAQKGRNRRIERDKKLMQNDFFLAEEINAICSAQQVTKEKAFDILAERQAENPMPVFPEYDPHNQNQQLALQIRKAYFRYYRRYKKRALPYPYYGLDIVESAEDGKVVIKAYNVKMCFGEINWFGDWTYCHPRIEAEGVFLERDKEAMAKIVNASSKDNPEASPMKCKTWMI